MIRAIHIKVLIVALIATAASGFAQQSRIPEPEAYEIIVEAYIYAYPLILMDVPRKVNTNTELDRKPGQEPTNTFHHMRAYPGANVRDVVRPDFNALCLPAWLDLAKGPVIVTVPKPPALDGRNRPAIQRVPAGSANANQTPTEEL